MAKTSTVWGTVRFRHGSNAAADDPLVWYSGSGLTAKRWLHADHLGSITAWTNSSGGSPTLNKYDEYGVPAATNTGRFQYTGQVLLTELGSSACPGLYYYKARIYSSCLGRFLQTDPVGYEGGINLYAYVGGDPVNVADPAGKLPAAIEGIAEGCASNPVCRNIAAEAAKAAAKFIANVASKVGVDQNQAKPQLLYRGITARDAATMKAGQGMVATNPNAKITPDQHIASQVKPSQFISTSKNPAVAAQYASQTTRTVAVIDASKLPNSMDFSRGSLSLSLRGNFNAIRDSEVLVSGSIPQSAIVGVLPVPGDDDE